MLDVSIKPIMIIGAEINGLSNQENETRTNILENHLVLMGVSYKGVSGKQDDKKENGFLVILDNGIQLEELKSLAFEKFTQNSVLVSDIERNSYVHNSDGTIVGVGKLSSTTQPEETYTYCSILDVYYTTRR